MDAYNTSNYTYSGVYVKILRLDAVTKASENCYNKMDYHCTLSVFP